MSRAYALLVFTVLPLLLLPLQGLTAAEPALNELSLLNKEGRRARLHEEDLRFMAYRLSTLQLKQCIQQPLQEWPRSDYRYLEFQHEQQLMRLYILPDILRTGEIVLVGSQDDTLSEYTSCNTQMLLPILAIMATAEINDEPAGNRLQQAVLADHSYLTSHKPSTLMLRNDALDSSSSYMDFVLSSKHPIFPNAPLSRELSQGISDSLAVVMPGDSEYYLQLYLAFTGRFSQYIGERNSSPVVARRFNPSLFLRFWTSAENYLDLEFGHESNGQRINSPEAFQRTEIDFISDDEPAFYARDSLSRGWDYTGLSWQRRWNEKLLTRLNIRHYLADGPLQGKAEAYNLWEDDGSKLRPRRQYDGLELELQYNFRRSRCLFGALPVCFQSLALSQESGYSKPFDNNTTTVQLTSDFLGLPIQLWGKTGYNNNLVDYYRYSSSWGLGIQLFSH